MTKYNETKCFKGLSTDTKPTGSFLLVGDEYFETDTNRMKVWNGTGWVLPKQEDLRDKHNSSEVSNLSLFPQWGMVYDIYEDAKNIVAVTNRSTDCLCIYDKANETETVLDLGPAGEDATDLPPNPETAFQTGIAPRNIADTGDYYVISFRVTNPKPDIDGEHLFGGIAFVDKSNNTVVKSYWMPYRVSRVVYDKETGILAVGLQVAGLKFYSVSGYTLTELEFFEYDWTVTALNGRESQNGCFFKTSDDHLIYANVGFSKSVRFYDVTDPSDIIFVSEFVLASHPDIGDSNSVHTYTGIARYPYLYITIARGNKSEEEAFPQFDGVMVIDVSDINNPIWTDFKHIDVTDGLPFNGSGDTKPTEMKMAQGTLYLNYERGYLAFEIDPTGREVRYCGKYQTQKTWYGLYVHPDTKVTVGSTDDYHSLLYKYTSTTEFYINYVLLHTVSSNPQKKIKLGEAFFTKLSLEDGYNTWGRVYITMGGVDITSTAYNSDTHIVSIASVTGDIRIEAEIPVTLFWRPSDSTFNQYSGGRHCTYTVDGNDLAITIPVGNSGIKAPKDIASIMPTESFKLRLKADSVVFNQPIEGSHITYIQTAFYDANNNPAKTIGFVTDSSKANINDVLNGITLTVNPATFTEHRVATSITFVLRTRDISYSEYFPIVMNFENLRLEIIS